jgi:hypothetical protein
MHIELRKTIDWMLRIVVAGIIVFSSVAHAQLGNYGSGFEKGDSPFLKYQRVRRLYVDVEPTASGLLVTGLYPNSPAKRMSSIDGSITGVELEPNDVIISVDGKATQSPQDLSKHLTESGDSCEMVVRDNRSGNRQVWMVNPVWANVPIHRNRTTVASAAATPTIPNPSKLFAIIFAATEDASLGNSVKSSLSDLTALLTDNILAERLELRILGGNDCTVFNLINTLETLGSSPNDSLLIYYLGHGAYDPRFEATDPYGGHFLDLPEQDILRKTLWDHMDSTYARLRILVTDSCNVQSIAQDDALYEMRTQTRQVQIRGATPIEWLMLGHRGRCDFGAASKGEFAWYSPDTGGWFTSKWISLSGTEPSWTTVRDRVIPETRTLFENKKNELESNPAALSPTTRSQLQQQKTMSPQILLTRLRKDEQDPIGLQTVRNLGVNSAVRVRIQKQP